MVRLVGHARANKCREVTSLVRGASTIEPLLVGTQAASITMDSESLRCGQSDRSAVGALGVLEWMDRHSGSRHGAHGEYLHANARAQDVCRLCPSAVAGTARYGYLESHVRWLGVVAVLVSRMEKSGTTTTKRERLLQVWRRSHHCTPRSQLWTHVLLRVFAFRLSRVSSFDSVQSIASIAPVLLHGNELRGQYSCSDDWILPHRLCVLQPRQPLLRESIQQRITSTFW